jgi:hypothetical protein
MNDAMVQLDERKKLMAQMKTMTVYGKLNMAAHLNGLVELLVNDSDMESALFKDVVEKVERLGNKLVDAQVAEHEHRTSAA